MKKKPEHLAGRRIRSGLIIAGLMTLAGQTGAYADDTWTYANPYGLDIAGEVQDAASDEPSVTFQENYLPTLASWINSKLRETSSVNDLSGISLDPSQLYLSTASDVRAYFVGEGAYYLNTLGFTTDAIKSAIGDGGEIIFPNASTLFILGTFLLAVAYLYKRQQRQTAI